MSRTIWKFTLAITDSQLIGMPVGAVPLCVQTQGGMPQLWAMVDPAAEHEARRFVTYGTGHDMPNAPGNYIGTYQVRGGELVFHVFESA